MNFLKRFLLAIGLPAIVLAGPALLAGSVRIAATPQPQPASEATAPVTPPTAGELQVRSGSSTVSSITRSGRYWSQTQTGFQTIAHNGTLQVSSIGPVMVEGDTEPLVRYTIVKRVQAESEDEARRRLELFRVQASSQGSAVALTVRHAGSDGQSAELRLRVPRTLAMVDLQTHGGAVSAKDLRGAVKAQSGGGKVSFDGIGGDVAVRTAGGEVEIGSVGGEMRGSTAGGAITAASIGRDASLETGGGDIQVGQVGGSVRASTAGGNVKVARAGGLVVASTAGGAIDIQRAAGTVTANNLGGPIRVGSANGVTVESGGGTIRLVDVSGALRAATAVGDIFASLAGGRRGEESALSTGGGDITVVIPAGYPLTIRAEAHSTERVKRIVSEFAAIRIRNDGPVAIAEGSLYGGGPLLRLASTNGTIYIKQQTHTEQGAR